LTGGEGIIDAIPERGIDAVEPLSKWMVKQKSDSSPETALGKGISITVPNDNMFVDGS
jgi:hypothetical protein